MSELKVEPRPRTQRLHEDLKQEFLSSITGFVALAMLLTGASWAGVKWYMQSQENTQATATSSSQQIDESDRSQADENRRAGLDAIDAARRAKAGPEGAAIEAQHTAELDQYAKSIGAKAVPPDSQ